MAIARTFSGEHGYYTSRIARWEEPSSDALRLPAEQVEKVVVDRLRAWLGDERELTSSLDGSTPSAQSVRSLLGRATAVAEQLSTGNGKEKREIVSCLIRRVEVGQDRLRITLHDRRLESLFGTVNARAVTDPAPIEHSCETAGPIIEADIRIRRHGAKARVVMAGEGRNPDAKLTAAVVEARGWFAGLRSGRYESLRGLANETGLDRSDIGRRIRLAFLAPDIVEAILEGRQPADLNLTRLKQLGQLPLAWADQRSLLGFSS